MHYVYKRVVALLLLAPVFGMANAADWTLDNEGSQLNFVSIKAGNVAETPTFDELNGHISAEGDVEFRITLDSVNTAIDIRNERMRMMLFDTASHPSASVKTRIDPALLANLVPGQTLRTTVESMLDLSGQQSTITAALNVIKIDDHTLWVISHKPILLNATHLGLEAGIEKLRAIAGLPVISVAVPVHFNLLFKLS